MKIGVALADVCAGKDAAIAILAASPHAAPADPVRPADHVVLAHSATAALVNVAQNALVSGKEPVRWGNAHPNLVPYQLFQTSDRPIVIAVGNDAQWLACCRALERPDLAEDIRYLANAGRVEHRAAAGRRWARPSNAAGGGVAGPIGGERGARRRGAAGVRGSGRREADARTGVAPLPPGSVRLPPPRLDEHGALVRARGWGAFDG